MTPFRPGQRVLCIDATPPLTTNRAPPLEYGAVYTVINSGTNRRGELGVRVIEASYPPDLDAAWLARRFVPEFANATTTEGEAR